jgi:hypothetical protein
MCGGCKRDEAPSSWRGRLLRLSRSCSSRSGEGSSCSIAPGLWPNQPSCSRPSSPSSRSCHRQPSQTWYPDQDRLHRGSMSNHRGQDLVVHTQLIVRAEEGSSHVLGDTRIGIDVRQVDFLLLVEIASFDLVVVLEICRGLEGVGVEGNRVHGRLLVLLGHVWPLGLDVVVGVGALGVLDEVLLRLPVGEGDQGADTIEEAVEPAGISRERAKRGRWVLTWGSVPSGTASSQRRGPRKSSSDACGRCRCRASRPARRQ